MILPPPDAVSRIIVASLAAGFWPGILVGVAAMVASRAAGRAATRWRYGVALASICVILFLNLFVAARTLSIFERHVAGVRAMEHVAEQRPVEQPRVTPGDVLAPMPAGSLWMSPPRWTRTLTDLAVDASPLAWAIVSAGWLVVSAFGAARLFHGWRTYNGWLSRARPPP